MNMDKKTIDQYLEESVDTMRQLFNGLERVEGQFVKCEAIVLGNENSISLLVEEFMPSGTVRKHVKHGKLNQSGGKASGGTMYFTSSGGALRFHGTTFTPNEVQAIASQLQTNSQPTTTNIPTGADAN